MRFNAPAVPTNWNFNPTPVSMQIEGQELPGVDNTAAVGAPAITGTASLGQMLSAGTAGISDANGKTKADAGDAGYAYANQWQRVDADGSSNPVDIAGATQSTYTVISADVGSKIRVQVNFRDDAGYPEGPLTSNALPAAGTVTCDGLWCATLYVRSLGSGNRGCANSSAGNFCSNTAHLSEDAFTHDLTDYAVTSVQVRSDGELRLFLNPDITAGSESLVLHAGSATFAFGDADATGANSRYWDSSGLGWSNGDAVELKLTESGVSADATLSGLALADSGGNTISLGETFVPATTTYTASVANGIETVTLTATKNDSNATVVIASDDNTGTPGVAELDLIVGSNTLTLTVTAQDGTTEREYTITVTRAGAPGVTVSETALTVTEQDSTGGSYTVALDTEPTANVVVTVAGHAGTDVTPDPATLTFTASNWSTAQTVTVTAGDDADTTDDTVALTHSAASADSGYSGIAIPSVAVTVSDNDTARVTGLTVTPGNAQLAVNWTAVDNATGYKVQWKSGSQGYNTGSRQSTVTSGSTTSHTITGLANGTEYTVRVSATRTGANDGPASAEKTGTPAVPTAPGVTVSTTALTVTEQDSTGDSYTVVLDTEPTANVVVTVAGHSGTDVTANPTTLTFTSTTWSTAQTVTVTAGNDADTTDDTVALTHSAASADSGYSGIAIPSVAVTVSDNDTAQVTGLTVTSGNAQLAVNWTAVGNATGYKVQWKSGSQDYNTGNRQFTVTSGSTTSHTITGLANGTEYTVQVSATRTGANDGPASAEKTGTPAVPTAPGVTVSKTALTVTEQDSTGNSYTVALDTEPTANVVVTVAGHSGTDVTANPTTLTFTSTTWSTAQTVTVTAGNDADTTDDTVALTHSAASADSGYSGIAIPSVAVTVSDNDTAQVTGLTVTSGNAQLAVNWTAVGNATGYKVQWKSGSQDYNTGNRQFTVTSGSTTSHTITGLANGTEYTVQVSATRTGANDGPASAEKTGTPAVPTAPGVTVSTTALTVTEQDSTGNSYTVVLDTEPTANVVVTVAGHAGTDVTPNPTTLTFTSTIWSTAQTVTVTAGDDADTDGRFGRADPQRGERGQRLQRHRDRRRGSDGERQRHRRHLPAHACGDRRDP